MPDEAPKRLFHRTVIQIELLTDEELGPVSIEDIQHLMTDGHASGMFLDTIHNKILPGQMARLLLAQQSDPAFLLDDDWVEEFDIKVLRDKNTGKYLARAGSVVAGHVGPDSSFVDDPANAAPFDPLEKDLFGIADDLEWVDMVDAPQNVPEDPV